MKTLILILLLIISWHMGYMQYIQEIDSLKKQIGIVKQDAEKVKILIKISDSYKWVKPDSALKYVTLGLQLADQWKLIESKIQLLDAKGEALSSKGNYSQALETRFLALKLSENMKNNRLLIMSLMGVGATYYYLGDFPTSLKYYRQAQSIPDETKEFNLLLLCFMGESYFHMGQMDSALFYIQKSYDLEIQKNEGHWSIPYYYMAAIQLKMGNTHKAIDYYRTGLSFKRPVLDSILGYIGLANVFKKMGKTDSTIFFAQRALQLSQKLSFTQGVFEAGLLLKDSYQSNHLTDSAFKYQEILMAAKDSLFSLKKMQQIQMQTFNVLKKQKELEASNLKYRNQVKTSILLFAMTILLITGVMLWRKNRYKQKAYNLLQKQKNETEQQKAKVENALTILRTTQSQLIQSEKMASLGELTAGIAHEIQNPLNFINNFSEVCQELLGEMKQELENNNKNEAISIAEDLKQNMEKILHHGQRADAIVKGMLQHSRHGSGIKEPTDINKLADQYLRLAFHGLRAKDKSFNATLKTDFDESIGTINVVPQDMGSAVLNLITNAFYAVAEKKRPPIDGYEPVVSLSTKKEGDKVLISVKDNGNGISQKIMDKIFQPFFTTKPTGQGTGLGLSMSFDIVKAHGGELKVDTKEGEGSEFTMILTSL